MRKFKVGDTVRINSVGRDKYNNTESNPHWLSGVVSYVKPLGDSFYPYSVDWDNDSDNQYNEDELELVEEKQMQVPYTITDNLISVFVDGRSFFVERSDSAFKELREHLKGPHDEQTILDLVDKKSYVQKVTEGLVEITENEVLYKGQPVHNALTRKLIALTNEGFDVRPWAKFMENLMENPSYRSREQLHGFLDRWATPITEDGCFLAFKYVRSDFKDAHTGTMDNSPGTTVSMPRQEVDDDPNRTCSAGLHACASRYLQGYAWNNKVVVVKINPKDVVSIPTDYDFSKMRVCEYQVLREVKDAQEVQNIESRAAVYSWEEYEDEMGQIDDDNYSDYYDSYEDYSY